MRDHAFTVTGGRVNQARRLEPGKNVRWEITVAPGSGADVTLALNATTDCSTQGAICTEDGRKLSGKLQLDVPGPNTPAAGAPTIKVTAQVGETLTASTSGISDADGLTNTTFTYQWLSEYTEISDATGKSYTVTDDDVGQPIRVRVSFTDDAGNAETLTSTATATVVRPPLTASAQNVPQSHDGQNTFTFEMEFSQEPDLSYTTIRDHAFTVTGGSVTYVRRLEPGRNIGWKIHVTPNGNGDVTLSLRSTTDCSAQGAICTEDGRKLSGGLLTSIPGPNTPATGAPAITGTPRVGETLTAVTSDISDQDGMDGTVFRYQWLADDADIPGATGSSYQVANEDEGLTIRLRVSFTDDGGNQEALTSQATDLVMPRATPPAPRNLTAAVNGDGHIVLSWEASSNDSITGYQILRRRPTLGEDTLLVYVADTQSPAATYTDTDITTGVQHVYRVKAINGAGTGPVSNYVNMTP